MPSRLVRRQREAKEGKARLVFHNRIIAQPINNIWTLIIAHILILFFEKDKTAKKMPKILENAEI